MSLLTRNQAKQKDMEDKAEVPSDENLTMEQKIDKMLNSLNTVADIQTDLRKLTATVNTINTDLTLLKTNTDKIPTIDSTLKGIQTSITTLQVDTASAKLQLKETQNRVKALEEENVSVKFEIDNLKSIERKRVNLDQKAIDDMITSHIRREKDRNCLMFEGVNEIHQTDVKTLIKQISYDAGVTLQDSDITEAYRIGKTPGRDKRPRLIKATFASKSVRNSIYSNRDNIKNNEACKLVWINECLDSEQRKIRSEIRAVVDLAKSIGREARTVGENAIISGIKYSHQSLHTLPPEITLEKAFTRELNGHIYFNSEHSPLSSFYPAEINYGNEKYCHNEQAYQHQRAVTVGNVDIAKQIKVETDPRKCKSLGHQLPNSQTWDNKKEEVMKDLIQIKAQIPEIKDKLSKTGELSLVECTADSYWACGASFRSQKVQTGKTTGQNKLGHIWMETRRNQRQEMNGNNDMPPLEDPK